MVMDELLYKIAEPVKNFAAIYLCDIDEVPDFNEVSIPLLLFFYWKQKLTRKRCMNCMTP